MTEESKRILVLCYGNPARLDDGLGPALGERLENVASDVLTVETNYQLTVEDSSLMADHDLVLFVDASITGQAPFGVDRVTAGQESSFSTHSIRPENLVALTERVFGKKIAAYSLGIKGYLFNEFGEMLSTGARRNLGCTLEFLLGKSGALSFPSLISKLEERASRQSELRKMKCKTASM